MAEIYACCLVGALAILTALSPIVIETEIRRINEQAIHQKNERRVEQIKKINAIGTDND